MAFHVFVEGPTDGTPDGVARLAEAIARHYGLPAPDLLARLQKGRFRVKGNIDRATADQYCRDLDRLGARCVIEEANAQNSQRATPLPFPAVRPATPAVGLPTPLPPVARPATPPARPPTPAAATQKYESGLSAAFSSTEAPAASLGALDKDSLSFSLSSVDGADDRAPGAFESSPDAMSASIGPAAALPASIGPAPTKLAVAKADKPKDVPLDLFAPPDAEDAKLSVDIADDEPPRRRSEPVIAVSEGATSETALRTPSPSLRTPSPSLRTPSPSLHAQREPAAVAGGAPSSKLGPLADTRVRFAAGVLLAILIGFLPAHVVASMREDSAYKAIDNQVLVAQQLADTPDSYAQLDRMRTDQLARKQGEQRNTAIIALAIWGLVGGALAFAWFKKVPWERFA